MTIVTTQREKFGSIRVCTIQWHAPAALNTQIAIGGIPLARTNFKYEKRQKELAKQAKAEEKRLRKLEKRNPADEEGMADVDDGAELPEAAAEGNAVVPEQSDQTENPEQPENP